MCDSNKHKIIEQKELTENQQHKNIKSRAFSPDPGMPFGRGERRN